MSGLNLATQRAKAAEIAERIKALGHEPVNPFDTPEAPKEYNSTQAYAYYMGEDIKRLLMCDAIFMCDGWENSVGCAIENSIANIKKMVVFHSLEQVRNVQNNLQNKISMRDNVKIFGSIVESESIEQIKKLSEYEPYKDSQIRIMPDVHAGKGCTVGTTMILDKAVTPNLVGVDIGCGMYVVPLGKVRIDLAKFDEVVNAKIPSGFNIHDMEQRICMELNMLHCREAIDFDIAQRSIGSLGGGNHFIELNEDEEGNKYLVIHSGSRNLGVRVCGYYQKIAIRECEKRIKNKSDIIAELKAQGREKEIQSAIKEARRNTASFDKDLAHLEGEDMEAYLHDMGITQRYAKLNRETIADLILCEFPDLAANAVEPPFHTIHNYIEVTLGRQPVLRKGAVSAYRGERLIIPMNMRDGSLICVGKGNADWNWSAPHGAGRLMSRKKAKESIKMSDFQESMNGVYSTSVCESTIGEAPQVYKPMQSIIDAISDTVHIEKIIKPIYNFKAKQ